MLDRRLLHHLVTWLGQWPAGQPLTVVGSTRRTEPGWDGRIYPAIGVGCPTGRVLSVAPERTAVVRRLAREVPDRLLSGLPAAVGFPEHTAYDAVFRWTLEPAPLPDVGVWLPASDPVVPDWLRPFGGVPLATADAATAGPVTATVPSADAVPTADRATGSDTGDGTPDTGPDQCGEVLVARDPDTGAYLAGVGIKRHDQYGHEIAVGTDPAARGKGLARRLVAQAARRVLDEGAVPTYLHDASNVASCRVAEAAGLPDRGWVAFGVTET
jgi:GNAT superfamily N-acetyltransferase